MLNVMQSLHVANDAINVVAADHYYEAIGGLGVIAAYSALKVAKRTWRSVFLSKDERVMSKRLRALSKEFDEKRTTLQTLDSTITSREQMMKTSDGKINAIKASVTKAQSELDNIKLNHNSTVNTAKAQIAAERAKWIKEKDEWDAAQGPCSACGSTKTSLFCGKCGLRQKSQEVAYVDKPFKEVNDYLHSIARWGRPMEANGGIVLPWPSKEDVTFKVGDIDYTWSKEDSEDYDGEWYATLEWEHPILGSMKLINKVQGDNAHVAILTDTETEYEMTSGSIEEIERADVALAVEQALTAMACWMQSKRMNP